jgi:hypothetical protein
MSESLELREIKDLEDRFEKRMDSFEKSLSKDMEKFKDTLSKDMEKVRNTLSNCVTYKHFYWVIGVLVTILIAVVGFISTQISTLQSDSVEIKSSVSRIDGKLEPYNIEFRK